MNTKKFYRLNLEIPTEMVYSAHEFREILTNDLVGDTIKKILVRSDTRNDWVKRGENVLDCSFMGGSIILLLENKVVEIVVHAVGIIEYGYALFEEQLAPLGKVPTRREEAEERIFYDLCDDFTLEYNNQRIKKVSVKNTNIYPFVLSGFDEGRGDESAENNDLPEGLTIIFENENSFQLMGDEIEYYFMRMQTRAERIKEQIDFTNALAENPPNYKKASELLMRGLDINAPCEDDAEENLLSSMLLGFGQTEETMGNESLQRIINAYLVDVIKFMLKNGFDLSKEGGRYGAMCLNNLTFCTHDENIVYAAKLLLDNGAKNFEIEKGETPLATIGGEASYLMICEEDHHTGNIFDTLYEIVEYADQGKDYHNIDIYFEAKNKIVQKVLLKKDDRGIFDMDYEESNHKNCFVSRLYFDLGDLFLAVDKWAGLICYKKIEDEVVDISSLFEGYIGNRIIDFEFDHFKIYKQVAKNGKDIPTSYGQTIAKIIMEDGSWVIFTDNHGEKQDDYVGYFTLGKDDKMGKKEELTQEEKDLIGLMLEMGFEKDDVFAVCAFSQETEVRKKLLKYLLFKGKYATVSDALNYSDMVERAMGARYQYLPQNLFVRFIRETTDELNQGDFYQVDTVYGLKDVVYLMMNEKDEMKEYPASDFIRLRPSLITYMGIPDENGGETQVTEGYELGKQYRVVGERGNDYVLEDGRVVPFFETDEIEFVPAEPIIKKPIPHDILLYMLRQVLEFGDMHRIYERMTDETEFVSKAKDLTIIGRDKILDYIEEISKNRVEQDAFSDVVAATVTEDDNNGHKAGERFLMMFHEDGTRSSAFLYSDGTFVTRIVLDDSWPAYECEETKINALGKE